MMCNLLDKFIKKKIITNEKLIKKIPRGVRCLPVICWLNFSVQTLELRFLLSPTSVDFPVHFFEQSEILRNREKSEKMAKKWLKIGKFGLFFFFLKSRESFEKL